MSRTVEFERLGRCFFVSEGMGNPRKGQYFLSGADEHGKPTAYYAPNDLGGYYEIVKPTYRAKQTTVWIKGVPVNG